MDPSIEREFERASGFSRLPRLGRWLLRPGSHFFGLFQRYVLNRFGGIVSERSCDLFTGDTVLVPLPAGLDIYLTGIKTHDSEIRLTRYILNSTSGSVSTKVAIDCGAHLGFYTLVLSHRFGHVVSFEPSPRIGSLLVQNTRDKSNVTVVHAMLADVDGDAPFFIYPMKYSEYNTSVSTALEEGFEDKVQSVSVSAISLDTYCGQNNIIPSMIKIDVEGGELKLLMGAQNILKKHSPILIIELRKEKFDLLYQPVVELLTGLGYTANRITSEGSLCLIDDVKLWITSLEDESDNLAFSVLSAGNTASR